MAKSQSDEARRIAARWRPVRERIEREDGTSLPTWAHHLAIGGYREKGWTAFDQRQAGKVVASGEWGDELYLMRDGSIACTAYPEGRDAYLTTLLQEPHHAD